MDKFFEKLFELFSDDPYAVIWNILKYMRTIFLLILSMLIYDKYIEHFEFSKNFNQVLLFFTSMYFLKPLAVFIGTVFVFDSVLGFIVKGIFDLLFVNRFIKKAKEAKDNIQKFEGKETIKRILPISIFRALKRGQFFIGKETELTTDYLKQRLSEISSYDLNKFNSVATALAQLICLFVIGQFSIYFIAMTVLAIAIIQYIKAYFLFYKLGLEEILKSRFQTDKQ